MYIAVFAVQYCCFQGANIFHDNKVEVLNKVLLLAQSMCMHNLMGIVKKKSR